MAPLFTGVSQFQAAVAAHWNSLSATAHAVLDRVNDLPQWNLLSSERPATLEDLTRPRTVLRFVLDPRFGTAVCRALRLDPRDVFRRETRPDRLLSHQHTVALTLTDHIHSVPCAHIVRLLQAYPQARLFVSRPGRPETAVTRSIIGLLMMAMKQGEEVIFRAEGEGYAEVLQALKDYNTAAWFASQRVTRQVVVREIRGLTASEVAREIALAMDCFGEREICGIFDPRKRKLFVGWLVNGHKEIAAATGLESPSSYTRINFDGRRPGLIQAHFPSEMVGENLLGRFLLPRWFPELFDGCPT